MEAQINHNEVRGEVVYRRTYSRPLGEEGEFETWPETIDRVIGHQRWLWERALTHILIPGMKLGEITEDMTEWTKLSSWQEEELEELRELMLSMRALLAGRTLWLGNTNLAKTIECCQFNCSGLHVSNVYDIVDLYHLLLCGCGVGFRPVTGKLTGFRKPIQNIKIIRSERLSKGGRETNEETFDGETWYLSIGDSSEAWAKFPAKLLANKYNAKNLVLDFSEIRPAGDRLHNWGWLSSGDDQIAVAFPKIIDILNKKAGNLLSKVDILDICNLLGSTLSSRRSAEIAVVDYGSAEWFEFAEAKKLCYTEGFTHRQQSNNSLVFQTKPTLQELSDVFQMVIDNGGSEPGFLNGQTISKRAPWNDGVLNPCAEILLASDGGFCCLATINLAKYIGDTAGLYNAVKIMIRANMRQTVVDFTDGILQEKWNLNNEFLHLTGLSLTGYMQNQLSEYELKNLYKAAVSHGYKMAEELNVSRPKLLTTNKPEGTGSKRLNCTEGLHLPLGKYIFNWINFSTHDPLVAKAKAAKYKTLVNPTDASSTLVCFPIKWDNLPFVKKKVTRKDGTVDLLEVSEETAIDQLQRYKKLMMYWSDQNSSITISYDPSEKDDIVNWLYNNWDIFCGVSFLFRADPTLSAQDLGFNYLPQEVVTEEKYLQYTSVINEIDFNNTGTYSEIDIGDECAGGMCPVK